jgi:hypothetical protein
MSSAPVVIPPTPVYGPQPDSPALPPETFVLDFAVRPAHSQAGVPTVALFAAGLFPGSYAQIYGGRTQCAVKIVAIHSRSGRVYHNNAERDDAVPLAVVMKPQPPPLEEEEAEIESIDAYFAVDLRAQLALPAEAAAYSVFLWLDEVTSAARIVPLPGPEAAAPARPAGPAHPAFQFRRTSSTPQAAGAEIALRRPSGESRVYGAAGPALLGPAAADGAADHLTILALDFRSRTLKWHSFAVPEVARIARDLPFDFDCNSLFGGAGWLDTLESPRRGWLVACLRNSLSHVLVVED